MASHFDFEVIQGQDGDGIRFPVVDGTGTSVDLTGWRARGQVRASIDSGSVVYSWDSVASPDRCTVGPEGVTLTWTAAQTARWRGDLYTYSVELVDPTGSAYRLVEGRITLDREVTR